MLRIDNCQKGWGEGHFVGLLIVNWGILYNWGKPSLDFAAGVWMEGNFIFRVFDSVFQHVLSRVPAFSIFWWNAFLDSRLPALKKEGGSAVSLSISGG